MKMIMVKVPVTQEHIDKGLRQDCARCPAAVGLTAVLKEGVGVAITNTSVRWWAPHGRPARSYDSGRADTPPSVQKFIWAFDKGRKVEPFTFSVELPQEILKEGVTS